MSDTQPKSIGEAIAEQNRLRGIGDVIARMTKAVGIAPCDSCKKRQESLNKMFPFATPEDPIEAGLKLLSDEHPQ